MRAAFAVTLLIMACASAARADQPPPPAAQPDAPTDIKKPVWIHIPTGDEFEALYPEMARQNRISGATVIRCRVNADGRLDPCVVLSEDPPLRGFGAAALQLAAYFQMKPNDRDGVPSAGRSITMPIRFRAG